MPNPTPNPSTIPSGPFYTTVNGHPPANLRTLITATKTPIIYLAGDSTLDNKFWLPFSTSTPPLHPYTSLLHPPQCKRDIAYALNMLHHPTSRPFTAINCAIEATTLRQRHNALLQQDVIISQHITSHDILVVSLGGNDIALTPTPRLILSALISILTHARHDTAPLEALFGSQTTAYINRLVSRQKPRLIVVCMLYFPLMDARASSWAAWPLRLLGYNAFPQRLQDVIRTVYQRATCKIVVDGCQVVPVPLFEALDGRDAALYVERVEPSEEGGRAIAELLYRVIDEAL